MSNKYNNLHIQIENLKSKVNKITRKNKSKCNYSIKSYKISHPKYHDNTKQFVGLLFGDDHKTTPFIKIGKNNIITYYIVLSVDDIPTHSTICSLGFGIRDKSTSKIHIIKDSKTIFDISNKNIFINNQLFINNTILYASNNHEELFMFAILHDKAFINNKKSVVKLLIL